MRAPVICSWASTSEGTSFCYRLTRTAGDSRAAARALFDGQLDTVLRSSNGVVRVH